MALPLLLASALAFGPAAIAGETEDAPDAASPASAATGRPLVLTLDVDSAIQPVVAEVLSEAIAAADSEGAAALVVRLNTPGGLLTSTREITTAMLAARTPVVVFVAPDGAQAASAGFFILLSGDVAAMAPSTNTGAAAPVGGQGEDIEGTMGEKVEQDAAATIRSLAARRGRDVELAESAVLESRSFSASEALELGLVDVVAEDLERLLEALDGREIQRGAETIALELSDAVVRSHEMTAFQRFRSVLVDPNIVALLLSMGGLGLMVELYNPGAIFPGVVGALCLILGLYGTSVLPVSYAGVALLALAGVLFVAEIKVQSFGLLAVAGVISLALGSSMLFRSAGPALQVSMQAVATVSVIALLVVGGLSALVYRAHKSGARTGEEGLVGERGVVRSAIGPGPADGGKVALHGELWNAVADGPVEAGATVEVLEVEGLLVRVRPLAPPPAVEA